MTLTSQDIFDAAHAHVAKWEGGFFDHPSDPGGVTNFGISLMFLKSLDLIEGDIDGDGDIDRADVLAITRETARDIFRHHFWMKPKVYVLPSLVAVATYDIAVNAGAGRAAILLQEGLNTIVPYTIANLAPNIGPLTRKGCHEAAQNGRQLALCLAFLDRRAAWYRRLVLARPSSSVFLRGWLNRTEDCRTLVTRLSREWGVS